MSSIQAIAMDVANAIPGCEAQRFALEGNTILSGRVMGWGPSLHRTGMTWACNVPADRTHEGIAAALSRYVETQMRRIGQAGALGLATDRQPATDQVAHIVADRVLLEVKPDIVAEMHRAIGKMISGTVSGTDTRHAWLGTRIGEGTENDPRPRLWADAYYDAIVYDGSSLLVRQAIPDTLAAALPGRRVDEVVSIDGGTGACAAGIVGAIGHRTIHWAKSDPGALTLHFDGDWIPVTEATPCATS